MKRRRMKVTVIYRNGVTVTARCKSFEVSHNTATGEVTAMAWDRAKPSPLTAGLPDIVAVWVRRLPWWRP